MTFPSFPTHVDVPLDDDAYTIWLDPTDDKIGEILSRTIGPTAGQAALIWDENVAKLREPLQTQLQRAGLDVTAIEIPSGETSKSMDQLARCYDQLAAAKMDRGSLVIALGGGVVGDLSGFVAASYLRGVDFVQCPTTLLAAVDSSVGGKTGINLTAGKNLVGAFHQPRTVIVRFAAFDTLPPREWAAGLAEVVKYGVILDSDFFAFLEQNIAAINSRQHDAIGHVVARSCRLKSDIVCEDQFETTGRRAILNYGHTFAHAYEKLLGYGELLHGEAVAIGMVHASRLAERVGRIDAETTRRQVELLSAFDLPTRLPKPLDVDAVVDAMRSDKKVAAGQLRFILPRRLGHVELLDDVPFEAVARTLAEAMREAA